MIVEFPSVLAGSVYDCRYLKSEIYGENALGPSALHAPKARILEKANYQTHNHIPVVSSPCLQHVAADVYSQANSEPGEDEE
jgi:hypothetical protein